MSRIQIIGLPQSNFVWATRIACAEKGVAHDNIADAPHTPLVNAIHPLGKIPVLRHGDVMLCESRAICAYIDLGFDGPSLMPTNPREAAMAEQWLSLILTAVEPVAIRQYLFGYMFPQTADGSPDRERIDAAMPALTAGLQMVARAIEAGHFGTGDFCLTDAYLIPILFYLRKTPEAGEIIGQSPALTSYIDAQLQRNSVRDTMPALVRLNA